MLINMVLPGAVETARLPKEFQEVEYLRSTGTQYIKTKFKPNQDSEIVLDMQAASSAVISGVHMFYGVQGTVSWMFGKASSSRWSAYGYYNTIEKLLSEWTQAAYAERRIITQDKNNFSFDSVLTSVTYAAFQSTNNAYLFGVNADGTVKYLTAMDLYSCQMGNNGVIECDFVPCYRKSDKEAGLYELISGEFYENAGTGAFVVGPDVNNKPIQTPTADFTYTGNYTDNRINGKGTVRLNSSGVMNVKSEPITVLVTIVAAGGGGATWMGLNRSASGGGGGNQTVEVELAPGTYEITIGAGGVRYYAQAEGTAGNGGDTIAFGYTSTGGKGGKTAYPQGVGGAGGSPNGESGSGTSGAVNVPGGSPNGGAIVDAAPQPGGDGYVELTFI